MLYSCIFIALTGKFSLLNMIRFRRYIDGTKNHYCDYWLLITKLLYRYFMACYVLACFVKTSWYVPNCLMISSLHLVNIPSSVLSIPRFTILSICSRIWQEYCIPAVTSVFQWNKSWCNTCYHHRTDSRISEEFHFKTEDTLSGPSCSSFNSCDITRG